MGAYVDAGAENILYFCSFGINHFLCHQCDKPDT